LGQKVGGGEGIGGGWGTGFGLFGGRGERVGIGGVKRTDLLVWGGGGLQKKADAAIQKNNEKSRVGVCLQKEVGGGGKFLGELGVRGLAAWG